MWFRFDLGRLLEGQMRTVTAKLKTAYNLHITGPRGLQCETNLWEIMSWGSSDVVRFDLGSLLQGQMRTAKLKTAYDSLIIGPRGLQCEPTYRKSCSGNFFDVGPPSRSNEDSQT